MSSPQHSLADINQRDRNKNYEELYYGFLSRLRLVLHNPIFLQDEVIFEVGGRTSPPDPRTLVEDLLRIKGDVYLKGIHSEIERYYNYKHGSLDMARRKLRPTIPDLHYPLDYKL